MERWGGEEVKVKTALSLLNLKTISNILLSVHAQTLQANNYFDSGSEGWEVFDLLTALTLYSTLVTTGRLKPLD